MNYKRKYRFYYIWAIAILLPSLESFSQLKDPIFEAKKKFSIDEITINDSLLNAIIINYIDSISVVDSDFKEHGYLYLSIKKREDKKWNCELYRTYTYLYADDKKWQHPLYYTFIKKRLLLVYTDISRITNYEISKKSMKKLVKLINVTLPKIEYQYIKDPITHQKKKLRPVGTVVLHGGINFSIP